MKYVTSKPEEKVLVSLTEDNVEGSITLVATMPDGNEWLLAHIEKTTDGWEFFPNKVGCKNAGLTINNNYN